MRYLITATIDGDGFSPVYLPLADEARFVAEGRVEFITRDPARLEAQLTADPAVRPWSEPITEDEHRARLALRRLPADRRTWSDATAALALNLELEAFYARKDQIRAWRDAQADAS